MEPQLTTSGSLEFSLGHTVGEIPPILNEQPTTPCAEHCVPSFSSDTVQARRCAYHQTLDTHLGHGIHRMEQAPSDETILGLAPNGGWSRLLSCERF